MNDSEIRLERLERRVRRLGGVTAMLACGWLVLIVWNFAPRPRLDAREFAVRDSAGRRRAALMVRDDGLPALRLDDVNGQPRLYAMLRADGTPVLRLSDSAWVHRARFEIDETGRPRIALADSAGRTKLQLALDEHGEGVLDPGPKSARASR